MVCVPVIIFVSFDMQFDDIEQGQFKVIRGQRSWCQSTAHGLFPIRLLLTPLSYLSPFFKHLKCNFDDLELRQFTVIKGHVANR